MGALMGSGFPIHYDFPHNYQIRAVESYPLVNPAEELHQFPAQLEEGDRTGIYLLVSPTETAPWIGFFAKGFESNDVANGVYSCPDPGSVCVAAGGYAYVVEARDPRCWRQIELRPVVEVRVISALKLLLFAGFNAIAALGESGRFWTTQRLSWEGLKILENRGTTLFGLGWDIMTDREVPFEVDLVTGESKGGARPHRIKEDNRADSK
jgi:hypothetical protein